MISNKLLITQKNKYNVHICQHRFKHKIPTTPYSIPWVNRTTFALTIRFIMFQVRLPSLISIKLVMLKGGAKKNLF